jgi:hypothetical protein
MFFKAIAAGRNPAAIHNGGNTKPCSCRHYSTVFVRVFLCEGFLGGESC